MSTVKSKNLQVGTDASASNNFTIYQPSTPDGTLRIGVGNADSPTEVGRFNNNGYVPATAPLFSAYMTGTQAFSGAGTLTKIEFNTETYDTANCYDTSNYRFTPNVAGYYLIKACIVFGVATGVCNLWLFRNGSQDKIGGQILNSSSAVSVTLTELAYCNGTTDFIEMYGSTGGGGTQYNLNLGGLCTFQGALIIPT
jgi:hypothetical protein